MNTIQPFEDQFGTWLEAGPVSAPDAVADTVLAAFPAIRQRRPLIVLGGRPWTPKLGQRARVALALVALLALVVAGANVFFPPPPQVGPPESTRVFFSSRYQYRLELQAGWTVRLATRNLATLETPWVDSDGVDVYEPSPTSPISIIVAGVPLEPGTTLDAWAESTTRAICAGTLTRLGPSETWSPEADEQGTLEGLVIDGEPALLHTYPICFSYFHQWAVVKHGDRAFHIVWLGVRDTRAEARATFLHILDSFEFTS
jgi:hypothetical protein